MCLRWSLALSAALFASLLPAALANQDGLARFSAEDVFDLEYAADPRISPSGQQIVYVRRSNDIMVDRTRSALWIIDVDGANHRPLVTGGGDYSSPRWSPDGGRVAYLARGTEERKAPILMVRWLDTGQTATIARFDKAPSHLTWSPDGAWIAFTKLVPEEREPLAKPPSKPKGAKWAEPVKVIDHVRYRWDGRGFLDPAQSQVFVVPTTGGTPRQLTEGPFDHEGPLSWSPGGSTIFFSANRQPGWEYESLESDLFAVGLDGRLTQLTTTPGLEASPTVSPDGRYIAYLRAENDEEPYRIPDLYVMARDGSNPRNLTSDLDRRVQTIRWGEPNTLYFTYDDRGERKVARLGLDGSMRDTASGLGGTTLGRPYLSGTFTVAGNGTIAYTEGGAQRPADVASWRNDSAQRLTALNDDLLAHRDLGHVHEINYTSSFDGTEIQGWYVTPPGFDPSRKYPLVLEIHGGPHLAYGPQFSAEVQRYAAEGYVVFYDNHRGSSSYGRDFGLLLKYKYSSREDFADHISGVDALIARGFVDADNLFVTGGSAGGIATAYLVGLTNRFKAAAAAKPVINWISKTLTADSYIYQTRYQFPALPWEDPDHYWERSPLSLVGNVTTPTMLLTGENDYRTPISETEQFYQALKLRRIDTVMVRVPGSSHGIAGRPSRLIAKVDNILAWFARYRSDGSEDGAETGGN